MFASNQRFVGWSSREVGLRCRALLDRCCWLFVIAWVAVSHVGGLVLEDEVLARQVEVLGLVERRLRISRGVLVLCWLEPTANNETFVLVCTVDRFQVDCLGLSFVTDSGTGLP